MTLHTPGAAWPWPEDDITVELDTMALAPWRRRGDSDKFRAFDPDAFEQIGSRAEPLYLVKYGRDAVAERLSYLVHRAVDLPSQHVFWAVRGEATVAAIPFIGDAVPMGRLRRTSDGTPYVNFDRKRVTVINESDRAGHMSLAILFDDLDGMETMVDPRCGLFFRVDGAAGHSWADALNLVEVSPAKEEEFIRGLRLQYDRVGMEWPGDEVARSAIRAGAEQAREKLYAGPDVARAVMMIASSELFDDGRRPLMLATLRVLATCNGLPDESARTFRDALGVAARVLTDGIAAGLAAMLEALRREPLLKEQ
jgi:hypothetical protein